MFPLQTTMKFEDLESEALKRPTDERAKLACSLILSLEESTVETDPELRKLWAAEAKRRYREYLEGKVELIPGEEAVRRARAALRR
jgi:hypothetical protein